MLAVDWGMALLAGLELGLRLWSRLAPPPLIVTLAQRQGEFLRSVNSAYARRFFSSFVDGCLDFE